MHIEENTLSNTNASGRNTSATIKFSHRTLNIGHSVIHQIRIPFLDTTVLHELCQSHSILLPESIRHSRPKRQLEFVAGRLAAQYALQPFGYRHITLTTGTCGEPLFPESLQGSISHSIYAQHCTAVACVHKIQPAQTYIGIDIEHRQHQHNLDTRPNRLNLFLHPREQQLIATQISPQQALLIFSAKESIIKAWFHRYQHLISFSAITYQTADSHQLIFQVHAQPAAPQLAIVHYRFSQQEIITLACI